MNLFESMSVAFEGLKSNKMRSALTMLGIIIGVGAVITMLALAQGAKASMMSRIQSMGTNVLFVMPGQSERGGVRAGMGSITSLTLADAEAIAKQCPSVEMVSPEVQSSAQVKYRNANTNTTILGTTPAFLSIRNYAVDVDKGRFFTERDVKSAQKVAVLGPTTATDLFGDVNPVGKDISVKGIRFTVIGVMVAKGSSGFGDPDDQIVIPISTAMRRVFGITNIRSVDVQASSMQLTNQATTEITNLLHKRHRIKDGADDDFSIRTQAEMMDFANQASQVFTMLLGGIAGVSLLVGGIGIMNIMLVSVTERTREIGIRMALGARRRDILGQFVVEALVLSLLGGAIGILMGKLGAMILGKIFSFDATVTPWSVMLAFLFSAAIGLGFGIYPAFKASMLDPIDALRYE